MDEPAGHKKVRVFAVECVEVLWLVRGLRLGGFLDIEVNTDIRIEV
jgi:hypothetical protein